MDELLLNLKSYYNFFFRVNFENRDFFNFYFESNIKLFLLFSNHSYKPCEPLY